MTNNNDQGHDIPLGVIDLISASFTLLRNNFTPIAILALAVTVLSVAFQYIIAPTGSGPADLNFMAVALGLVMAVFLVAIQTAVLTGIAFDSTLGKRVDLAAYIRVGLAIIVPLILISITLGVMIGIGLMALVLPGLYLAAMFSVTVPALIIERLGFGSIARSVELTKNYRWPILGFLTLMYLIMFALVAVVDVLTGGLSPNAQPPMALAFFAELIANFVASVFGLGVALVYARLREIKEGVGMNHLAKVFD